MAEMLEITTRWTSTLARSGLSIMYFNPTATVETARLAWGSYLNAIKGELNVGTRATVATEGRVIEAETGELTGMWSDTTTVSYGGASSSEPVANASQVLLRWNTVIVINGRMVKGKTYIPGLSSSSTGGGELPSGPRATFTTPMTTFITTAMPVVWHRPGPKGPGLAVPVSSGSVWNELAVQRRRR
uniref:Uncharacterized protein n=1 Tax=uncultured prokaryote TaxID=198431 RepID=A0A0H5Q7U6_9ZZZZ|nr:hypothetical protein [uncultured prokaryote]